MFEGDPGLYIGTSSWSERDWVGVFYPGGTPPREYIRFYSQQYDTVEIDSTFYAFPAEETVRGWRARTRPEFTFAAKVPRLITHEKQLLEATGDMLLFVETMAELHEKLGPLVLQFPHFRRSAFVDFPAFAARLDPFLRALPAGFRYVVEVRNRDWVGPELAAICREHDVAVAWTERPGMPGPGEWVERLGGPTSDHQYIRWLGDHHAIERITQRWNKTVVDRTEAVRRWLDVIRDLRRVNLEVRGYFNNHFAGHAPESIELFRELYAGHRRPPPVPPPLEQGEFGF